MHSVYFMDYKVLQLCKETNCTEQVPVRQFCYSRYYIEL